ncbi:hypothetical protein CGRA01v4_10767 [Colletotrichum graminicola]|uniref:Uncharacterized protein n=1 Tax=Colletotrichum graminicola (strain M1.001 / M2 / FGSC 10212) TaxID=645133 RepID=E3QSN3_COLGM|nr:uncharacterized protein GLRG_09015 [Colletotrichum graminicola M1.001]EFQ33871.1 hypothetical protein GLRG_09015 [Colletotrichum graminicola M1.001]WDK19480.1 hypothetical protein CGRA01v4_10767 [Colletotrichum graminicola]
MIPCPCGRRFKSDAALAQHQTDKNRAHNGRASCCAPSSTNTSLSITETSGNVVQAVKTTGRSSPANASNRAWLWKQIRKPVKPVYTIVQSAIVPSTTAVSSEAGCQLVCSYNWQGGRRLTIRVPGFAAIWQDLSLPLTLPPDKGTYFIDQNTNLLPQHPFEAMFRAAAFMNPDASFNEIDIVTNRNSLRKLFNFCLGRSREDFRLNLHLVRNTLIVERCEKLTSVIINGSPSTGWGRNFEEASAKFPAGLEKSLGHHRTLRYSLGALSCAVQFEVDASYDPDSGKPAPLDALLPRMEKLSVQCAQRGETKSPPPRDVQIETVYVGARVMDQSTAAEIKSATQNKTIGQFMPQLWFGRTPWLIVGRHAEGKFGSRKITDAAAQFAGWEATNQETLRKLVTVLGELRTAVRKNEGRHCAAVFERGTGAIVVVESTSNKQAISEDLRQKLWT